jgi:hypothetical protein
MVESLGRRGAAACGLLLAGALGLGCGGPGESTAARASPGGGAGATSDCADDALLPEQGRSVEGDLIVAFASDAAAARDVSDIDGDLIVLTSYAGALELPNLERVGGSVRVSGETSADGKSVVWPQITELRLPNLTDIGDELYVYLTDALVETDLHRLERVGTQVYFMRNLALRRAGLDSLREGSVSLQACPVLAACEVEAVCSNVGASSCGEQYSDPSCSCELVCGRIESSC